MTRELVKTHFKEKIAYLKDVKANGVAGGEFTSGDWRTRDLNTVEGDNSFVSLDNNQFTLQVGKYEIEANSTAHQLNGHVLKLRNITSSSDSINGNTARATGPDNQTTAFLKGIISISEPTVFELQHRAFSTKPTDGLGRAANVGAPEIYTTVKITKIG